MVRLQIGFRLAILIASGARAETVWQIGVFNDSPVEFEKGAQDAVTFYAGKSDAAKDWPGSQITGHPYRILFNLDSVSGTYRLKIGALIDRPRVPALRMEVNGHAGTFFLHPQLSYSRSDFAYAFDPHESQSTVEAIVPRSFLKAGENAITITCVDDPPTPARQEELGGISYDALSLEHDQSPVQSGIEARLEPTILFRQTGSGLAETVDAFIRFPRPWTQGRADLEINGQRYTAAIDAGEFGEVRTSFEVAEWKGSAQARIGINAGQRFSARADVTAARKWTLYVVPHTHLDIGFTDYQGKIAETQARVLTQAAGLIAQHPDFRFSMDGSWNLQQILETRSKGKQDEITGLIRTGRMALPAQNCNLLTGYASLETLYRSLYVSRDMARRFGLPFEYANITDVPTYSGSYPSVLAGAGVKYWVGAANNDRAPVFSYDQWNQKSPFWWVGPDGKKVLFWYSRHYMQVQTLFGLPPQLNAVRESLPIFLQAYSKPSYKPDVALIYGTQVENTDLFPSTATFATEWDKLFAYPKLVYATFPDFFHYIEQHYGNSLETFQGDGGGYWEDGIGSDAYYAQEDRSNQNRVLSGEVLSTAMHSADSNLNPPKGLLDHIWQNIILFSEHTWASYNSVSQPDHDETGRQLRVKDDRADRANLEINDLVNRSLSQLANDIHIPADTLVVFNSLNWTRDLVVETDLSEGARLTDLTTNQEVALETLKQEEHFLHVRFVAEDVPGVGYKCFRIESRNESARPQIQRASERRIENAFYRIKVDEASGSIESIYDKQLQREIVDAASPYKFGQYLYVTGGDGDTQMINPFPALPPGKLTVHASGGGKLVRVERMPWGQSIQLISSAMNTPRVELEVLLLDREKKIEFRYRVQKEYTTRKEGVYIAFPVAVEHPEYVYATQQQWVNPARNLMKGGSLEWFNIQYWMAVEDTGMVAAVVPIDTPLASFGDINRGTWPGTFNPKTATLFSYVMNNYWHTNYRAGQGGDFTFRYALTTSAKLDSGALTKFGMEEMRPAEINNVVSQDKVGDPVRPLPETGAEFMRIGGDGVALITWKEAANGKGTILRLQEIAGRAQDATVRFPRWTLKSAQLCSGVEDDLRDIPVEGEAIRVRLKPFEVLTVRVSGAERQTVLP